MNLSQPYYIEKRKGASHINLDGKWSFTSTSEQVDSPCDLTFEHTATLPASTYVNLVEAGIKQDPYFGVNSKQYHDVYRKIWYYKRSFNIEKAPDCEKENAYLCFDGVAYFSRVWLNGVLLGEHEGMFGGPVVNVADKLKVGENLLVVEVKAFNFYRPDDEKFFTAGRKDLPKGWSREMKEIVPWNVSLDINTSNGDFVVMGIWRSVRIECIPKLHISRPYLYTKSIEQNNAVMSLELSIASDKIEELKTLISSDDYSYTYTYNKGLTGILSDESVSIGVEFFDGDTGEKVFSDTEEYTLYDYEKSGIDEKFRECQFYRRDICLENIELWNPLGLGKAKLYDVSITISKNGIELDRLTLKTGIRTIEQLETTGRKYRQRWEKFRFCVNGKEFFLKGMNYMPIDFLYNTGEKDYRWIIEQAKNAGIQLLRVWSGGGMPEDDCFYDICDELGILVWQDSFFANYFDTTGWDVQVLENQLCYYLFRLRNHPSLAVHCGGNEFPAYAKKNNACLQVIHRNIEDLDFTRKFYRTTPDSGSMHSYRDIEPCRYRTDYKQLPFIAESGIHSFPNAKSLRQLISHEEYTQPLGDIMDASFKERFPQLLNHFTEYRPDRVPRMLSRATHITDIKNATLEDICEATQLASYEFYQFLVQSQRENYPVTAGLMPWVFKRSWTTVAIQLVDGLGEPIAPYYAVKNSYAPIICIACLEQITYAPSEKVQIPLKIINESAECFKGKCLVDVFDPSLNRVMRQEREVLACENAYITQLEDASFDIPCDYEEKYFFVRVSLTDEKGRIVNSSFYPLKCLERMKNEDYRRQYRENPAENFFFDKGPYLKAQISSCKKGELEAQIKSISKHDERISLEISLKNTSMSPIHPIKLEIVDDKTTSYASDNYFFLDISEDKQIELEIRNVGDKARELTLEISAWNMDTQSFTI